MVQAVLMALPALVSGIGSAVAGAGSAVAGAAAAGGGTLLSTLRVGTSAISALSGFAQSNAAAQAQDDEAKNELFNVRQEFITAQQKANEIQDAFNDTIGDQLAAAASYGIDVGSGSVRAAQTAARTKADTQLQIVRNGADMNAALRRARAGALYKQASTTRIAGVVSAATGLAGDLAGIASTGGYKAAA